MFEAKLEYANGEQYSQVNLDNEYFVDFVDRGSKILVVTFFAMGMVTDTIQTDYPWGFRFLSTHAVSMLGVKPAKTDWYRGKSLHKFMRSEALFDLLKSFDRIVLYGTSMGGYPNSDRARSWAGVMVHIQTENGVWRTGGSGYTWAGKPDAWVLPFEQAVRQIDHCGPEKCGRFLRVQTPSPQPSLAPDEDTIVEAMIDSLRDPFPLTMLSVSGGIDRWREIMRTAHRASLAVMEGSKP